MNRLDVRALGWVVTRDACAEVVRVALGRQRQIPIAAIRTLGDRWRDVSVSPAAEQRGPLDVFLASPLSKQGEKAVLEFIATLQYSCPDLYSQLALRQRYRNALCQAVASFVLGACLAYSAPSDFPIFGDAMLVLFAIGCWSLVTSVQLGRTRRLVKQVHENRSLGGPVTHQTLRHQDRS